jgi:hypothetical protein
VFGPATEEEVAQKVIRRVLMSQCGHVTGWKRIDVARVATIASICDIYGQGYMLPR